MKSTSLVRPAPQRPAGPAPVLPTPERGRPPRASNVFLLALLSILSVATVGCHRAHPLDEADRALQVSVTGPRRDLRPGEALQVWVRVANITESELSVARLDAGCVTFFLLAEGSEEPVLRRAVASPREARGAVADLAGGAAQERPFVLLRATERDGAHHVQARYETGTPDGRPVTLYSPAVTYRVAGERLFRRDATGLISEGDAVRLCEKHVGTPAASATTRLVTNEAGFNDWWVTLAFEPGAQGSATPARRGFLVNPYLGRVRSEVRPDDARAPDAGPAAAPRIESSVGVGPGAAAASAPRRAPRASPPPLAR